MFNKKTKADQPKKSNAFVEWFKTPKHIAAINGDGGLIIVKNYEVKYTPKNSFKTHKYNTKGLSAYLEEGVSQGDHASKGAIAGGAVAGAVLLGPIGAVAGGLLGSSKRKGGTNLFFTVRDANDVPVIQTEFKAKDEIELRKLVQVFNESATDPDNQPESESK